MKYQRFTIVLLVALCAMTALAQSGRRQVKPPPAAPIPTPTPEPTPVPKQTDEEPELLFLLGADRNFSFSTNLPESYYDAALRGCAERLQSGTSAIVDVTGKDLTRGEAIKRAKSEQRTYVVHFTLGLDTMARSYDDLVLEYIVLAPGTAKIVTSGRAYTNGRRAGPVVVGPGSRGSTSGMYREELLRRAGEDAGERIIKALHLNVQIPR